jgi:serine/threonine-protein kinase
VVLYEMMSGRRPFTAESYPALLPLIIEAPHPALPASVPVEARTVVAGCLAKDRADRYPSADALLEAIRRARAALPAEDGISTWSGFFVSTGGPAERASPPRGAGPRHGLAVAILAVPVFILIAAAASGLSQRSHAPAPGSSPGLAPPAPDPGSSLGLRPAEPGSAPNPVVAAQPIEIVEPVPPSLAIPPVIPVSARAEPSSSAAPPCVEPAPDSGAAPPRF